MNKENVIKSVIVLLALTTVLVGFMRPKIDQEFSEAYAANLDQLNLLSDLLALDLLQLKLGYVRHYDYVEADLQRMHKASEMALLAPEFVSQGYTDHATDLISKYRKKLQTIRGNVGLIKRYVGLINNSSQRSAQIIRDVSAKETDSVVLSEVLNYQRMIDDDKSEQKVLAQVEMLRQSSAKHSVAFSTLMPHAGIISRYKPILSDLLNETNLTLTTMAAPREIMNAYRHENSVVAGHMAIFLWVLSAIGAALILASFALIKITHGAKKIAQTTSQELAAAKSASDRAVSICTDVLSSISQGEYSKRIGTPFEGELDALRISVNHTADRLESTTTEVSEVLRAIENGHFEAELADSIEGTYGEAVGSLLSTLNSTFDDISGVMEQMCQGDFSARVNVQASGEIERLKNAINQSVTWLETSLSEISTVVVKQKEGDLTHRVINHYPGQLLTLSDAVNFSLDKMQTTLDDISNVAAQVQGASTEITQGNSNLSDQTKTALHNLQIASDTFKRFIDGLQQITSCAAKADQISTDTSSKAIQGQQILSDAMNAMERINESSQRIKEIVTVIDDIAFQTNLLALNASVEAARAGEQGLGFAVVASEVRMLAGKSAEAAKQIKCLIDDSSAKVERGCGLVSKSGDSLGEIVLGINDVVEVVEAISSASSEQAQSIDVVSNAVDQLDSVMQNNVKLAEIVNSSSQKSTEQIIDLKTSLDFFHASNEESGLADYRKAG